MKTLIVTAFIAMMGAAGPIHADEIKPVVFETIYQRAQSLGYAQNIAKNCRSIRLKRGAKRAMEKWLRKYRVKHGVTEAQVLTAFKNVSKKRIQDDAFAFIRKNDLVVGEQKTFCAAGKKLINNGSEIGNLLVER